MRHRAEPRSLDIAAVQRTIRTRVLRLFEPQGLLTPETVAEMRQWERGGGFHFDAGARIEATDRKRGGKGARLN
jgi:hypothetical protein